MISAKDNPFSSARMESLPFQFQDGDWVEQLQRLNQLKWRAAIIGPKGSGKTTLLLELKQWLQDDSFTPAPAGHVHYCFVGRNVRDRSAQMAVLETARRRDAILLIDGIERFTWRERRQVLRNRTSQLVVTAHRPIGLPVWLHCGTSVDLAQLLLRQMINKPDRFLVEECARLFKHHRGNIREVFRSLYDQLAIGEIPSDRQAIRVLRHTKR